MFDIVFVTYRKLQNQNSEVFYNCSKGQCTLLQEWLIIELVIFIY